MTMETADHDSQQLQAEGTAKPSGGNPEDPLLEGRKKRRRRSICLNLAREEMTHSTRSRSTQPETNQDGDRHRGSGVHYQQASTRRE